ncbi:MAG TPA: M64 family metallopeptidase, partial [Verrucomicrobium sp.]|nr:M64 family metallopeptidase [Verrucomicrobium sp.]
QKDYDKAVDELVKSGLSQSILEPFKLLQNSINYWSVFVRSQEDGISLLGEYEVLKKSTAQRGTPVPYPAAPPAGATSWSVDNMIHEVGLPLPNSPTRTAAEWVTHWSKIYPATATVALVQPVLSDWVSLQNRTTLNERDSVFGFAHRVRTRVSDGAEGDPLLRPAFRRPTEASIDKFIEKLVYGNPQPGGDPYNIGETWANTQKDRDLVCFVCLSDIGAGEARAGYFAATTGFERLVELQNGANGKDILTSALSNPKAPFSAGIFASRVAHECGHAFGLGDEYGPGSGSLFVMGSSGIPIFRNTQVKDIIVSAPVPPATLPVYDTSLIKWLLPRTTKTATLAKVPGALGGRDFEFWLTPGQGTQFAVGDLVQVRKAPMRNSDPYINLRFKVAQKFPDKLEVTQTVGQNLDPLDYDPSVAYVVNCVNQMQGSELKLIADPVLAHIASSASPLNAPPGATGAACVAVQNASPVMTPTNLPAMTFNRKRPAALADIIGVYEGAAHFDCGVFRPAGRCKMRSTNDDKVPFCHVCRYIIVDRVDATRLAQLDVMYDPHYPI